MLQCLAATSDIPIPGRQVAFKLTDLIRCRNKPEMIVSDQGTEFTLNAILAESVENYVEWRYKRPGKPIQNAMSRASGVDRTTSF